MIQGSAADLIKMAMIKIDRRLREHGLQARMILQIHDELVFEAPEGEVADLAALVRQEMNTALALEVPLKVDLGAGGNWLDVEAIEGMRSPNYAASAANLLVRRLRGCLKPLFRCKSAKTHCRWPRHDV